METIAGYAVWKPLMEHYLMERRIHDVLKMKIDHWKALSEKADQLKSKASENYYRKFGITWKEPVRAPQIKAEKDSSSADYEQLSEDEVKQLSTLVHRVRTVYSILYDAIPIDVRNQIGSEHHGNGAYLWNWLEERLLANTVDVQHEIIGELFTLQQSQDEKFEAYKARVDVLNDRLAQAKIDLPSAMYRYIVLKKLRPEYRQIVVVIDLSSEYKDVEGDGVGLWNKITLAITRFERTTLNQESSIDDGTAMSARNDRSVSHRRPMVNQEERRKKRRCYGCNELGHYKSECPKGKQPVMEQLEHVKAANVSMNNHVNDSSQYGYAFSAVAHRPKPLYSEVVCAGMSAVKRSAVSSSVKTAMPSTEAAPKPLKRLIRPPEPREEERKAPEIPGARPVERAPLQTRTVSGKPIEKRLKGMTWGIDTMASVHCTGNKAVFATRRRCTPMRILVANDETVVADQVGTVKLRVRSEAGHIVGLVISDVYYCPELGANLLSGVRLRKVQGMTMILSPDEDVLITERGTRVPINTRGNLATIEGDAPAVVYHVSGGLVIQTVEELVAAHVRLGHVGFDRLVKMLHAGKTRGLEKLQMSSHQIDEARKQVASCVACREGRGTATPYSGNGSLNRGSAPGEVLHFDTFEVRLSNKQVQYGVAIVEPYSGVLHCPRAMSKDLIVGELIKVIEFTSNATRKVKFLYTDGGTEFINRTLKEYCAKNGIQLHYPPPRTPKWNGFAERAVRTIKDGARVLLRQAGLPDSFWYYAVSHYLYLWNRTFISSFTGMTPFEVYYKQEPSVNTVSVFGCDVYVWLHKRDRDQGTFAARGEPGVYLGHDKTQNCAIVWLLKSQKDIRTRSVDYREDQFNYSNALRSGDRAIREVISCSEIGGSLAWMSEGDDHLTGSSEMTQQSQTITPSQRVVDDRETEDDTDHEERWTVEKILKHRQSKKSGVGLEYSIKWKNYKHPTWEPAESLRGGADELLQEYHDEKGLSADAHGVPVGDRYHDDSDEKADSQ
jgi:hypothetical protein